MKTLATHLRYLQFLAHSAHNLAEGKTFFADHEFLGGLYPAYETAYDAVVERIIGTPGQEIDLVTIQKDAAAKLQAFPDVEQAFAMLLLGEDVLCRHIERLASGRLTQGTLNLLAGIADESEVRQYKIGQRRA